MSPYSRREFLKTGIAAGAVASVGSLPLEAARRTATDLVTLGKSNVKVTRLAFGTAPTTATCSPRWDRPSSAA